MAPTAQSSSAFGALEAQAPCSIWRFDEKANCREWNHEASRLLKRSGDSLSDMNWMSLFVSRDAETLKELLINPCGPAEFQLEVQLASSTEDSVLIKVRRLETKEGLFSGHVASGMNISELHQTRLMMLKAAKELESSNQELEQYAYVVSHDLQEPLRMITGFCELLKEECDSKLDANAHEYLQFIYAGAKRMNQLIQSLLDYSQLSRKKVEIHSCDLKKIISDAKMNLHSKIQANGARISAPPEIPLIQANEVFLTQIFQNLIENSLKYRHPDRSPVIEIAHEVRGERIVVHVKDNGKGIDSENKSRIFKLFQRASSPQDDDGLGIGLALTKKLAESLEGSIEVESDGHSGSEFRLTLPLHGDPK